MHRLIQMMEVSKVFGGVGGKQVLKDLDFFINKNQIIGLLGETGCGKTTLAKLIIGLEEADKGEIYLKERKLGSLRTRSFADCSSIQYIFQDPYSAMDSSCTVEEILLEPFTISKKNKHRGALTPQEALKKIGIEAYDEWKNRKIATLSGGQRQKICIARAIIPSPEIIIADESTSMLDKAATKEILKIFKMLKEKEQVAILIISHHLDIIKEVCEEVAILRGGRVIERGKISEILQEPQEVYTKELLACMNLFMGG